MHFRFLFYTLLLLYKQFVFFESDFDNYPTYIVYYDHVISLPYRLGVTSLCFSHTRMHSALARNWTWDKVTGAWVIESIVFPTVFARNEDTYHATHHNINRRRLCIDMDVFRCDTGRGSDCTIQIVPTKPSTSTSTDPQPSN
jgi:hypothetical protein